MYVFHRRCNSKQMLILVTDAVVAKATEDMIFQCKFCQYRIEMCTLVKKMRIGSIE